MSKSLTPTSIVQRSSDQLAAPVDDEVVILSIERGSYYGLDDIGTKIWEQIASPVRIDVLCDALASQYDADRATIERDVIKLLERMVEEGLITAAI